MSLAFVPLYIKYIGMEAYGLVGLYAVLQAGLSMLDLGMTPTLNREMARFTAGAHSRQSINDLLRTLEITAICIAVVIAVLIWGTSGYLATDWLRAEKMPTEVVAQALTVIALVVALRFVESIYRGTLLGLQRQVWYNSINAAVATLRHGGAVLILIWVSPTVSAYFAWQAAISLLSVAILWGGVHRAMPKPPLQPKFTIKAIADVWRFASGVMLGTFLAILLTQIDKLLLTRLLTLELFGYYTLAGTVAGVLYIIIGPITTAFYPQLVELTTQDNQSTLVIVYHQGSQLVTLMMAPVVMLLIFFPGAAIYIWSGNATLAENTAEILSIIVLGVFLNGLMHMPTQLQLAYGWVSLGIKTNIVAVLVLVPALFLIVPRYGAVGAAWIWVFLNAGYVLIALQFVHRRLLKHEKWRWYIADVLLPSSGAICVMLFAQEMQPTEYQNRWHWLIFVLGCYIIALVASTMLASQIRPIALKFAVRALNINDS